MSLNSLKISRNAGWLLRLTVSVCLGVTQITACSTRDLALEEKLLRKLNELKSSNATSIDLNNVLGKNWRKFCVQGTYTIKEDFNRNSGEKINRLLDISDNELAIWVFYTDNSIRTAILKKELMDFGVSTSISNNRIICASKRHPYLYVNKNTSRPIFYFND